MRFPILTLLPFLVTPAIAQNEEVPAIPGLEQPPAIPAPVDAPPAPVDNAGVGDKVIIEPIEELKLSGQALADLYRLYTGRRVIVSSAASQAEFQFIQYASPEDPLTHKEAAELLKKAATIENFIFVPAADLPGVDYLTLATAGVKPAGIGIEVYTENDTLPEGDSVISYIMPLSFLKPDEAMRVFQQVVGQFGAFGSITTSGSSVVITENTSLIRKLIDLKTEIDKPSSQVSTRFINVTYADVTELAATLNELLGAQQTDTNAAGVQRQPNQPAVTENTINVAIEGAGAPSAGQSTPVQIIPDPRTNRIFAMGRPVDLLFVEGLVREFDTESDQRNFLRRKLKFLAVADFLPIAGDALTRAFTGTGNTEPAAAQGGQAGGGGNRNNNNRQQSSGSLFNGGGAGGGNQSAGGGSGGFGSAGGGGSGSRGNALSDPDVNSAPESVLIGRTLLVADNITNSIVVQGPPSGVEIIEKLLDQVDVKADQVMISTVFGQLSLSDETETGVDWLRAFRGNENGGLAGSIIGGGPSNNIDPGGIDSPVTGSTPGLFPNQSGLSLYGRIGNSLAAYVNLLSNDSDFTILSRPSIYTANNQKGTISSGRRIAVPTSSNQFNNSFSTNIEYRDVVLKLEVIPLINSEDEVTLQIALVSDDVIGNTPIEGVGLVPIIGTRELLTTVTVPNNQTIVLGGLITTNDSESVTGIPILSDIPGLGRLFSTKNNTTERDELMIFIQPSIVNGSGPLDYVQADMDSRYEVSADARRFADGTVLPPLVPTLQKGSSAPPPTVIMPALIPATEAGLRKRSLRPIHRR